MYIVYENELGRINLNGGVWRIKEIEGLGLAEKNVSVITYPGADGQELLESVTTSRIITMSGDILRKGEPPAEIKRAIRILNKQGVLKIQAGGRKRKISCRCSLFSAPQSDRNAVFQQFVLQLTADCPYFEDFEAKKYSLFSREDKVSGSFTLPCVFTERISSVQLINSGDTSAVPRIFIVCEKDGEDSENYGIEIINHTTGQTFTLLYQMSCGEEICVDFENRTVKSNIEAAENNGGNLIIYMSQDTFLSDFSLCEGVNILETKSLDASCKTSAFCEYSNKYIEAVI